LQELIELEPVQAEKEKNIARCKQAIAFGKQDVAILQAQAIELESTIKWQREELIWQERYQPYAEKYLKAFNWSAPTNQEQIKKLELEIERERHTLERAKEWLATPPAQRTTTRWMGGTGLCSTAQDKINYLEQRIPDLEKVVEDLRLQPEVSRDTKEFRQYVQSRVDIQPALQKFLDIQEAYFKAIQELEVVAKDNEKAFNFKFYNFAQPPQAIAINGNNQIVVVARKN